jgi:predicted enzyme related to lactoylglutathione lyase
VIGLIRFRYLVNDVDKAVGFYTANFEFKLEEQYGPAIAILERDGVQLVVSGPMASASKPMPDGTKPVPGGWSRMVITVDDIESVVSRLKNNGVRFKNDLMDNQGRKQILCLDPSDNIIELFQEA